MATANCNETPEGTAAAIHAAMVDVIDACDASSLARHGFEEMHELFEAIQSLTDEHSNAHGLAGIGKRLTDHWSDLYLGNQEELEERLETLRAMKDGDSEGGTHHG